MNSILPLVKLLLPLAPIRGESHVLGWAREAQEGEGGVEKESCEAGRSSICPSGKPAINNWSEPPSCFISVWRQLDEAALHMTDRLLLSVRSTSTKPTPPSTRRPVSPISSIWRRSNSKSWKNKVSRSRAPPPANSYASSEDVYKLHEGDD